MAAAPNSSGFTYSVRVDTDRNVLYLTQAGVAEKEDMLRMFAEYERGLRQVRDGWVLVNDQSQVRDFSDEALEIGAQMVTRTGEHGVGHVIRIKPQGPAMRIRITRTLIAGRATYLTEHASSLEEAETLLSAFLADQSKHPG